MTNLEHFAAGWAAARLGHAPPQHPMALRAYREAMRRRRLVELPGWLMCAANDNDWGV